ncbi:MAG TPA: hypothetical protein VFV50_11200 [Bdellovibrionales bacterium]|nr:hypothetical protein [Bdellovibrionales bacterium]
MKTAVITAVILLCIAAQARTKPKPLPEDVPDFEFSREAAPLTSSFGFQEGYSNAELVREPELTDGYEPFKEIESNEIDDNFSVSGRRRPASN